MRHQGIFQHQMLRLISLVILLLTSIAPGLVVPTVAQERSRNLGPNNIAVTGRF